MHASPPLVARKTLRRLFVIALFLGLIVLFRRLLVLLAFFVAFERMLAIASTYLERRLGLRRKHAVLLVALGFLAALNSAVAVGAGRAIRSLLAMHVDLPARVAAFRQAALFQRITEHLPNAEQLMERAEQHADAALEVVMALGHVLLYSMAGFILALLYVLERDELGTFKAAIDPRSLQGTLLRWIGHVADALVVTMQFQFVVAVVNAVFTLPILLVVGIRHPLAFTFMVFFSGLVPVAGNLIAGAVLAALAFEASGWVGVGAFVVLTFVLHKIESYYLNPRLAARHVRLPTFVLVVSLIVCENLFGFVGLFVSFPLLFVASRIRSELLAEDEAAAQTEPSGEAAA